MNQQKDQLKGGSKTDKGYDEAAHTPWVSGTRQSDDQGGARQGSDEDEEQQAGLGGGTRPGDPTDLQTPDEN